MSRIFSSTYWPSICLRWRNVYLNLPIFCLGFFLLLFSCMSYLNILEIKPLLVALFANVFSQSRGCLFALFIVSFAVQKILGLIRSNLFIFVFYFHYSRRHIQENITAVYVKRCSAYVFLLEFYSVQSYI